MKSMLRMVDDHGVKYQVLVFVCPGCTEDYGSGLHILCVNTDVHSPSWTWDGNLEAPTLTPSILTRSGDNFVCHSYLKVGVFEFLSDCTHALANQQVSMPDLPDWVVNE